MQISRVTPQDYEALRVFDLSPLPQLDDGILQMFVLWCPSLSFLATDRNGSLRAVALAMHSADRRTVLLHRLVVAPEVRGRGWGGRLLATVEAAATLHGAERLALFTSRAAEYYLARGYVELDGLEQGEIKAYNVSHRAGRYYMKSLTPAPAHGRARPC